MSVDGGWGVNGFAQPHVPFLYVPGVAAGSLCVHDRHSKRPCITASFQVGMLLEWTDWSCAGPNHVIVLQLAFSMFGTPNKVFEWVLGSLSGFEVGVGDVMGRCR